MIAALSPSEMRTLKALKKDPLTIDDLSLYQNGQDSANSLVAKGLANLFGQIYSISQAGHKFRLEDAQKLIEPTSIKQINKPETISLNAEIDVKRLSKPQGGAFKKDEEIKMEQNPAAEEPIIRGNKVSKALQLMRLMGECTVTDIRANIDLGTQSVSNLLKTAMGKGEVIVTVKADGKKYYSLTKPTVLIKSESTYGTCPVQEIKATAKEIDIPAFLKVSAQSLPDVPELVADQFADIPAEEKPLTNEFIPGTLATVNDEFKLAITNQQTLILFGFGYSPIELTRQQTQEVADFLDQHHPSAFI